MVFTPSEAVALGRELEALERPKAKQRQRSGGSRGGQGSGNLPEPSDDEPRGEVVEVVAPAVGMGRRTYEKAKSVVEATENEALPVEVREMAAAAITEMDETGS